MQINRKSFGTLKSDRYGRVPVMDEWPLRQVLLYLQFDKSDAITAPRRNNRCAMIQVNGLIKSCRPLYKTYFIINYIVNYYNYRHKRKGSF